MLFSSSIFLFLFLPAGLLGYHLLSRLGHRVALGWLTFASLFFYGVWNPAYLLLLTASILFNYLASRLIAAYQGRERLQTTALAAAILGNLLLLGYFKYLFPVLNFLHLHRILAHPFQNVILPLGISFFTFTQIACLVDLKQGLVEVRDLLSFTLFVTFFPHLIAGPIVHPREIMPQFARARRGLDPQDLALGLTWVILGLAKKVLLADPLSPIVAAVFDHPHSFARGGTLLGVLFYAMQIYFDFSGYSDMAVGLARMFSIDFPLNFNSPFKSASIVEFWTRWHMTLSRYLNEYLYFPLSRSILRRREQAGKLSGRKAIATPAGFLALVAVPTVTTMAIAGSWHGAGLQFLVFGLLHGIYLTAYHLWRTFVRKDHPLHRLFPRPVSIVLTFLCCLSAFVFFRAADVMTGASLLAVIAGPHPGGAAYTGNPALSGIAGPSHLLTRTPVAVTVLLVYFAIVWFLPNTQQILGQLPRQAASESLTGSWRTLLWRPSLVWGLSAALLFAVSILMLDSNTAFLYFQF